MVKEIGSGSLSGGHSDWVLVTVVENKCRGKEKRIQ